MANYSSITEESSPAGGHGGDMARPRSRRRERDTSGQASMISSIINLLNTIIGAGTLAMPAAMSHMGVMLGTFVIVWSGLTSAFGLYLQSRCARYLDRGTSSFFALSKITYPNAAVLFDAAIAVKCFGVGVSYMIIIGDLMPGVMVGFDSTFDQIPYLVDRRFWITAFMLLVIPISFLKRLDSLKYTSVIALISIGYLIILVFYHFTVDEHANPGQIRVITWGGPIAALSSLPVVVFAYTCHQNMFSILNEIKDNSPSSVVGVIGSSIGSAASIYILVAITGYLTFGNDVVGNIVMMYPPSIGSTIAKAAIVILVTFSIPLQVHPCRASLDAVLRFFWHHRPFASAGRSPSPGGRPLLAAPPAVRSDHGPAAPMSDWRFALLTTLILVLSYISALSVSSLDRVLAYVGSTGSTSISFILPGLFYYKISDPNSVHHQRLTKEDDDVDGAASDEDDDEDEQGDVEEALAASTTLAASVASIRSGISAVSGRLRRRWRWDLEHLEQGLLRKLALALAIYGFCVMVVCLGMNIAFSARES